MKKIEFCHISKETIKPSSSKPFDHTKSYTLSFLDQVTPTSYIPLILFYSANDNNNFKLPQITTQLKTSLSETLSIFYPFSGRVKDNLIIHNYEEGVPFIETRVNTHLTDFLQNPQIEILNQFLPFKPFNYISNPTEAPPVAIQLNIFYCGGIAIGACMSHKIADGASFSTFLNSWADSTKKIIPDFLEASILFPPLESSLSQTYESNTKKLWFGDECKYVTKRFVFGDKAIATIKNIAKGESFENSTRIKALSSFIWKLCTEASRTISDSSRPSLSVNAVNIRPRTNPTLPENSIGNLFCWTTAGCDVADTEISLQDLAALTSEAIAKVNQGYLSKFQSQEKFIEFINQQKEAFFNNPDMFIFTSWINFGFNELDFGWGRPTWVGVMGEVGSTFTNLILFIESMCNNGIEAWITLEKKIMDILERDPQLLKFTTPNPSVLMP